MIGTIEAKVKPDLNYVIGEDVLDNAVYVAFSRVKCLDFWTHESGFLDWVNGVSAV